MKAWKAMAAFVHQLFMNTYLKLLLFSLLLLVPAPAFAQGSAPQLITTFTNPTPAFGDLFGAAVAAMGTDRVLVGTDSGGGAYLFSTCGTLRTTFTVSDPAASGFGNPLVAVGEDRVLISAYSYGTTAQNGERICSAPMVNEPDDVNLFRRNS